MEKKSRPWWHWVLGCGCLAILVGGITVVAGGAFLAHKVSQSVFLEPAKVDALAVQIFPGAKPPDGEDGQFGMDAMGIRMASLGPAMNSKQAPAKGSLQIILMDTNKVLSEDEANNQMANAGNQGGNQAAGKGTKVLKSEVVTVQVGGKPFPAKKQLVENGTAQQAQYVMSFRKGQGSGFIVVQGASQDFNQKGMEQFLTGIDSSDLQPLATLSPTSASPAANGKSATPKAPGAH